MDTVEPPIAAEIARMLAAANWTVRKLRAAGFGSSAAESLLGKGATLPSLSTAEAGLRLIGRSLWHRPHR